MLPLPAGNGALGEKLLRVLKRVLATLLVAQLNPVKPCLSFS
jgi:hypothetical protein